MATDTTANTTGAPKADKPKFDCPDCHKQFSADPSNIRRHKKTCQGTAREHQCRHCTYRCKRSDNLARHIRTLHPPAPAAAAAAAAVGGANADANTNGSALQVPTHVAPPVPASVADPVTIAGAPPVIAAVIGANDNADINGPALQITAEAGASQQLQGGELPTLSNEAWDALLVDEPDQDLSMGYQFQEAPLTYHQAPANPWVLPAPSEDMLTGYQPYQQPPLYNPGTVGGNWSNDNGQFQEPLRTPRDPYEGLRSVAAFTYRPAAVGSDPTTSGLPWTSSQPSLLPSTGLTANIGDYSYPDPSNGDGFHEAHPAAPEWAGSWTTDQPPQQYVSMEDVTFNMH